MAAWYEQFAQSLLGRLQTAQNPQLRTGPLATQLQNYLVRQRDKFAPFPMPTINSPSVIEAGDRVRRRLSRQGGRESTLLTGGLLGTPFLDKQGLRPV